MDRERERRHIHEFLQRWEHDAAWAFVEEPDSVESPDALLRRQDGSAIVGLEVTTPTVQSLAHARRVEDEIVAALESRLTDLMPPLEVWLSFENSRALGRSEAALDKLARLVRAEAPSVQGRHFIRRDHLEREEVYFVRTVRLESAEAVPKVGRSGYAGRGPSLHVVQAAIDAKLSKLPRYRTNVERRRDGLQGDAAIEGVWLLLVSGIGPGAATSIWTAGAEELARRDFERVFVLDYRDRRVREVVG